jgi:hypothetical protein
VLLAKFGSLKLRCDEAVDITSYNQFPTPLITSRLHPFLIREIYLPRAMAPSKAIPIFRRAANFQPHTPSRLIPCRRIANLSRIRTAEPHAVSRDSPPFYLRRCALSVHEMLSYPGFPLQTLASSRAVRRSYSAAAEASASAVSERPEPPDYLDEKEKAIFERLNSAFEPVALEVCNSPLFEWGETWARNSGRTLCWVTCRFS